MVTQTCFMKYVFFVISNIYYLKEFANGLIDFSLSVVERIPLWDDMWRKLVVKLEV